MNNPSSSDPNNAVTLIRFKSEIESVALLAALAEMDIHGTMTGSFTTGFRTEAPGDVAVIVRQRDLPKALEVLTELEATKNDIDWSTVDVGMPDA